MEKTKIVNEFNRIKNLGFVKSKRKHNTGIGKTFEDYLGVYENNDKLPDFDGFEVKSQRALTSSYLTLFTKSPSSPSNANTYLRDTYGEPYEDNKNMKRLHTSIFSSRYCPYMKNTAFCILNDKVNKVIKLSIQSIETKAILDESVQWTYRDMEDCLSKKLNAMFYVNADTKIVDGEEEFHYTKAIIYMNPSLENLLKLIDDGKLMVDLRIGSYKSGKNKGKAHDHGTGFRIRPKDLDILYKDKIDI